ncbi:MAG: hypothetical protein IH917_06325 [Acidobacteria bacterium]|nr:hypothetical protein [Acidobacteriota bacterium]
MPWYRVEIPESDVAADSATALMENFAIAYRGALSFGPEPSDVSVHYRAEGGHVYYFSPGASKLAPELLRQFNATACAEEPDLSDFVEIRI